MPEKIPPIDLHPNPAELRLIPAVDELIRRPIAADTRLPRTLLVSVVRDLVASVRQSVRNGSPSPSAERWDILLTNAIRQNESRLFARVINATGVVLHTNLGRAPLSPTALEAVAAIAGGYNNLEYTVETGERGSRHIHGETMLKLLTGAEAAMVVNNGAAAILLALSAVAAGREVILSRGEMIEIGGSFRVPDIMAQSGCRLIEVGTTNRTHLLDYQQAISSETGAILKVHTSNYRINGFTAAVSGRELSALAHSHNMPLIEDLGSGVLLDTAKFGITHEPTVQEALAAGVDLVTCSGDKLLGGPQAGLILGKADLVARCKRHPLARALRVGKLTLAALQATLTHYLQGDEERVPIWRMCGLSLEQVGERAAVMAAFLRSLNVPVSIDVTPGKSAVGGGSLPGETLPTMLLAIRGAGDLAPQSLAVRLRKHVPPVVARVEADYLLLDLRTVDSGDDTLLLNALQKVLTQEDVTCT